MDKKDGGPIDLESLQRILALSEPTDDAELTTADRTRVFVGVSPGELNRTIKGAIAELTARRARDAEAEALVDATKKALMRFSDMNGQVSAEVWNDNWPAIKACRDALAPFTGATHDRD